MLADFNIPTEGRADFPVMRSGLCACLCNDPAGRKRYNLGGELLLFWEVVGACLGFHLAACLSFFSSFFSFFTWRSLILVYMHSSIRLYTYTQTHTYTFINMYEN